MKTINEIPEQRCPREKLLEKGACALTDEKLATAILLGVEAAGVDVNNWS